MYKQRTNAEWLTDLRTPGVGQAAALDDLRYILSRASQKTLYRSLSSLPTFPEEIIAGLVEDCTQEAVISILSHLPDFQGGSKFSTWAYKFAVNISLTAARREHRKYVPGDSRWGDFGSEERLLPGQNSHAADPEQSVLKEEIREVIREVFYHHLTARQREVLQLLVFEEVPVEQAVERLKINRNALYKMLHDARHKIKYQLLARGIDWEDIMDDFGAGE